MKNPVLIPPIPFDSSSLPTPSRESSIASTSDPGEGSENVHVLTTFAETSLLFVMVTAILAFAVNISRERDRRSLIR